MRPVKLVGFLAVASLAASAWIGAGSASALSALCTEGPEDKGTHLACKAGSKLEEVEVSGENEGNAVFVSDKGNVECTKATLKTQLAQVGGAAVGPTNSTFTGCTSGITGCKVLAITTGANIETEVIYTQKVAPEGNVVLLTPLTTVQLECAMVKVHCTYAGAAGESVSGAFYNNEQKVKVNAVVNLNTMSVVCPAKVTLVVNYKVKRVKGKVGGKAVGEGALFVAKE